MSTIISILQWVVGAQLLFWGLNGFFHFKPIPPSDPRIEAFVTKCYKIPALMTLVKGIQVLTGGLLLWGVPPLITALVLLPIISVITTLHLLYNSRRLEVLAPLSLPYYILLVLLFWRL